MVKINFLSPGKIFLSWSLVIILITGNLVLWKDTSFAQETATGEINDAEVIQAITADEEVTPQDLDIEDPKLLPDSQFYFLKNWARKIRLYLTFNPIKKMELESRYANERLIELKKLVLKKKDSKIIKKSFRNYENGMERIKSISKRLKESASQNPKISKFLDKFISHQVLHQRILEKLEKQAPSEVFQKIKEVREQHLRRFGEVITKLENKEKIQERLEKNLEKLRGSKFKNLRNLEVLKKIEKKAPKQTKEAIRKARERILKKTKKNIESWSPQDIEKFKTYIEKISGDKEEQLEILENLRSELKENPEVKKKLQRAREVIIKQLPKKTIKAGCPKIELPAPDFCKEGRIVFEKDKKGCVVSLKCVIPAELKIHISPAEENKVCIALWDPVCGKDGRTYSNECFAKTAGVEISYKGVCRKEMTCQEKCKSAGYSVGICRTWPITPVARAGCKENEENIGQTSDCRIAEKIVGIGKTCCCIKLERFSPSQPPSTKIKNKPIYIIP